jgi:hypothetical protein
VKTRAALIALLACAAIACPADAHRLDEYLQATRISIERDRVVAEINLTPGAAVADDVFAAIDRDRDEKISPIEGATYAEHVVKSLSLEVDGVLRAVALDTYSVPSLADMRRGEGVIRLRTTTRIPAASAGRHRLSFENTHRSDIGVYLINALIPRDDRIRITGQSRDMLQHEFKMDYAVSDREGEAGLAAALPPILGLMLFAGFYAFARRVNA